MDLAGEIQRAIFPARCPKTADWEVVFFTKPQGSVSGDFFDFYLKDNVLKGISLFDVSGHGVAPALITILAKPVISAYFYQHELKDLGNVLISANKDLSDELEDVHLYITGIILRMNKENVEYINAGHPDLLHFKPSLKKVITVSDSEKPHKGHPIGISITPQTYPAITFSVEQNEFLIFYSDGITESRSPEGNQYGPTRLQERIASFQGTDAKNLLEYIMVSLESFTNYSKASDDLTLIIAKKL
jgi:sigma-B regulation protein RsbU (phosphoserine phosphatase)